jgi:ABC-type lipoprotein export system ATPase subunit
MKLTANVEVTSIDSELATVFDYEFTGETVTEIKDFDAPEDFGIGLIVGPSGSGKSTLLSKFGEDSDVEWDRSKSVASHFADADDARNRLSSVGFNSVKNWMQPHHTLSNGQQFRADLARKVGNGVVIDEFTSVINREAAKSCSVSLRRYVDDSNISGIVLASCHYDIIEWLQPDWCYDVEAGRMMPKKSARASRSVSRDAPLKNGTSSAIITISTQEKDVEILDGLPFGTECQLDLFQHQPSPAK